MERKSNRVATISAFVLGIGLTAMQANAQQGTFNLPVQAHWGGTVLQPGEHRVQIPLRVGQALVYLHSGEATQITAPLTIESSTHSNRSYLHLARVNGEYYVDEYQCGVSGQRFIFPKPKAARGTGPEVKNQEATLVTVAGD